MQMGTPLREMELARIRMNGIKSIKPEEDRNFISTRTSDGFILGRLEKFP
jgi:hypothetical protein